MASFLNLKMLLWHQILDSVLVANECVDSFFFISNMRYIEIKRETP